MVRKGDWCNSYLIKYLRLVSCPNMSSTPEKFLCALKQNMYSVGFGWNDLYISYKSIFFPYWFSALDDVSIDISDVLKVHTIVVLLSVSSFRYVNICFICLDASMLSAQIFTTISSWWIDYLSLCNTPFCFMLQSLFWWLVHLI